MSNLEQQATNDKIENKYEEYFTPKLSLRFNPQHIPNNRLEQI